MIKAFREKYTEEGKYELPNQNIDPREKSLPKYCKETAEAIYSSYLKNKTAIPSTHYSYIQTLRDYGAGNQSESLYADQPKNGNRRTNITDADGSWTSNNKQETHESVRKGFKNQNTRIVSIARNIMNSFHGILSNYEEDVFINNIDEDSGAEEMDRMARAAIQAKYGDWMNSIRARAGMRDITNSAFPSSVTSDELESFFKEGGFKLEYARIMEKLLKHTYMKSDWLNTLKPKWTEDSINLNFIAGRCYYDTETGEERIGYVDPSTFVIQYSKERDFRDSEYAGYFTLEKISKLRTKGIPEEELRKSAKKYKGYYNNPSPSAEVTENSSGNWKYDGYLIPVFHVEWIDTDTKRHLHYTNVWGKKRVIELDYAKEVKELSKKQLSRGASQEVKNIAKRIVYQASWIIDTDIVYDHGVAPNQSRWSKKEPMLSFFAVRGIKTNEEVIFGSITEAIIPFYDGFHRAWLKFQNSLSNVIDQGYAINLRLLANMKMGGEDLSEEEAIKMFRKSGLLPYMDMAPGIQYRGGDVLPIHEIQGGLGTRLIETIQLMEFNLNMISQITGISPVILGQTPESGLPVRTMQQQLQGTNNSIRPIINNIFTLKEELASASSIRIQTAVKHDKEAYDNYCKVVGRQDMEKIKEGIGLGVDYGIRMETRPSQEEKQRILDAAQAALQRGRDGEAQLDFDVYLYIEEQIMGDGNLKEMRSKLRFVIRKEKEIAQALKERNIQLQGQMNAQIEQQKMQGALQLKQMDVQLQQQQSQQQIAIERMNKNYDANIKWFETIEQYLNETDEQTRAA